MSIDSQSSSKMVGCEFDIFLHMVWGSEEHNDDTKKFLARAIWGTCSDKAALLVYAMKDNEDYEPSTGKGHQNIFIESIIAYDMEESSEKNIESFTSLHKQCEDRYNHILEKIHSIKSVSKCDGASSSSHRSSSLAEQGSKLTKKVIRFQLKNTKGNQRVNAQDYLSMGILLNVDILHANNRSEILREFYSNTRTNFNTEQVLLTLNGTTNSKKGQTIIRLSEENQTIVFVLACIYTLVCSVYSHIQKVVSSLGLYNDELIMLEMRGILGGVTVDLIKLLAIVAISKKEYVIEEQKTFTEYYETIWSKHHLSLKDHRSQECLWKIVTNLDQYLSKSVNELFFDFLSALGLAARDTEIQSKCDENRALSRFILNTKCHGIFKKSWIEPLKYLLGEKCSLNFEKNPREHIISSNNVRENIFNVLREKFYVTADVCAHSEYFKWLPPDNNNTIQIIVEQSFQVFVVCNHAVFHGKTDLDWEIKMSDIWAYMDKRYSLPLQFLSQFADLNSVASNWGKQITEEGVGLPQILVIGNINKASIMRGLRQGIQASHMLNFLSTYSPVEQKRGHEFDFVNSVDTLNTNSIFVQRPYESASSEFLYHIPHVVSQQIQHWHTESRRLLHFTSEKVSEESQETDRDQNIYPYLSFWWNLIGPRITIEQLCDPSFFIKISDVSIIIGEFSDIIQNYSDSKKERAVIQNGGLNRTKRIRSGNESQISSLYGKETVQSILRHSEHEKFILIIFDTLSEVLQAFGEKFEEIPVKEIQSNLPGQKDYRFVSQISDLTFLAAVYMK